MLDTLNLNSDVDQQYGQPNLKQYGFPILETYYVNKQVLKTKISKSRNQDFLHFHNYNQNMLQFVSDNFYLILKSFQ